MSGRSSGASIGEAQQTTAPGEGDEAEEEPGICWVCGAAADERHCKIICPRCGFMRDCSDP